MNDRLILMNGRVGEGFSRLLVVRFVGGDLLVHFEEWGPRIADMLAMMGSRDSYEYAYTVPESRLADFLTSLGVDPTEPLNGLRDNWSGPQQSDELDRRLSAARESHGVRLTIL